MNIEHFPKAYVAHDHENDIYTEWEKSGAFQPHNDLTKPAFSIIMPPPNANGNLHMGHALVVVIEDLLTRWHRMKGDRTLWLPGSDHAGLETQVVFEKKLEKEGRSRFQMTREQFYKETWDYVQENKHNMEDQVRSLGASCDWSAERFTLDPQVTEQVYATFRKMYDDGLIYRGERIVNYSVKYQTAYSDIEVVHEERIDPLYYLKYGPITVATVRPETTFGDVAIAVHPNDPRYKEFAGKEVEVTFATGEKKMIPVIADDFVDQKFGTGAVKITPAHDPNDYEMAQRHNLPLIEVINRQGRLTEIAGEFAGLKVAEARARVTEKLQEMGLVEKIDTNYKHSVALCYKSNQPIEPLVMPQWYIKVESLAKRAIEAIENGEVQYHPASYKKIQLDWLRNLKDWNISRQVWWGIPINGAMPENPEIANDPDTFDTWFSSGQWPILTLKALNMIQKEEGKTGDDYRDYFQEFYPTTLMETGRDLIFPWVSRMLMLGLYLEGKVPFKNVYFHGLVLDKHGKKMSKSKGNVVSPVELMAKYGTDAVRFGLLVGSAAGSDIPMPEEKIIGGRNFANKLWNMSRFVLMQMREVPESIKGMNYAEPTPQTEEDASILKGLKDLRKEVDKHLENYRFAQALQAIHEFAWHQYADVYIEQAKTQIANGTDNYDENTICVLYYVLKEILKLSHPFMPFVTEAIYQNLPDKGGMLITQSW